MGSASCARRRYDLPAGYALLVGCVLSRRALRTLLAEVLAWSMVLMALLSIAGAVTLRLLFRRMVSQVSQTADAISSGGPWRLGGSRVLHQPPDDQREVPNP